MSSALLPADEQILSFVKYSADQAPDTPRLTLSLNATAWFHVAEISHEISFTITRDESDPDRRPCVIQWDPIKDGFGQGIRLLCGEANDWRPAIPQLLLMSPHPEEASTKSWLKELRPGTSVSWETNLPSAFLDAFIARKFYSVFWCGGKIPLWDWGTLAEHTAFHNTLPPKSPEIVLPGGAYQTIEIIEESDPEDSVVDIPSSPSPFSPSDRNSDAPSFTVTLTGPETLSTGDTSTTARLRYPVTVTVSYDEPTDTTDKRPITFLTSIFRIMDRRVHGFRLYTQDGDEWRGHQVNYWLTHDAYRFSKPSPFKVGHDDGYHFQVLKPGESWSFTREITDFPKEYAPGDRFRYRFNGDKLSWWDWGSYEDHKETVVWIEEDVLDSPKDNGGRPVIVVPESNSIEFTLTE